MLAEATGSAGLDNRLDAVLSIEEAGVYKPDPATYQIAVERLDVAAGDICFVSTNAWDAAGAANFRIPGRLDEPVRPNARSDCRPIPMRRSPGWPNCRRCSACDGLTLPTITDIESAAERIAGNAVLTPHYWSRRC